MSALYGQRGFVLAAVLVTGGLGALLVLDALTTAALAQAAVTRMRLRHETFEAAEAALALLTTRLAGATVAAGTSAPEINGVALRAAARLTATEAAPENFSAARFRLHHFDLEAEASAARATRIELRAGVARWSAEP